MAHVKMKRRSKYAKILNLSSSTQMQTSNGSLSRFLHPVRSCCTVTAVSAALQTARASNGSSSPLSGVEDGSEVRLKGWQACGTETPWQRCSWSWCWFFGPNFWLKTTFFSLQALKIIICWEANSEFWVSVCFLGSELHYVVVQLDLWLSCVYSVCALRVVFLHNNIQYIMFH